MAAMPSNSSEMLARIMSRWPREPLEIHRWTEGPSHALVLEFSPHVYGLEFIGTLPATALGVIKPPIEKALQASSSVHVLVDAESLDSHEGAVRDEFVALFRRQRSRWDSIHVLYSSALIGMTVSAVGLLFLGAVKGYRDHGKFYTAVEHALRVTGSPG